ncbi:hypothetical protein H9Q13_02985 [Pontibacter sp. JH31]|uniref:Uncharacterized protein n=1 Tax=Pontibacter aquaedesilientis TaxID=2766980 RepID=A0ABR7XCV6_9BACT|nr:hypothetical protein [Pontibacter aquaedesilientis]MBD1396119.1 hypothetical protein [Pontibacter aquaedesilientis]
MKKLALLITFALMVHSVWAQQNTSLPTGTAGQDNLNQLGADNVNGLVRTFDRPYEGIKGNPYFLSSWGKAVLNLHNDHTYANVELKYNLYENNFLYRKSDGTEMILNAEYVSNFTLNDSLGLKTYEFTRPKDVKTDDPKLLHLFFVKLYDSDQVQLLMLPQKKLIKPDYKGAYTAGRNYQEFSEERFYYIIDKNKAMQRVALNRRNLMKVLSDKESDMQAFLVKNRLDVSTEAGWLKALAHYESL